MRLFAFCLLASPLAAADCPDTFFQVEAPDADMTARVCRSAVAARESLLSCGVELTSPLKINVLEKLPEETGPCYGVYHCGENRIDILSPNAMEAARGRERAFEGIGAAAFWDSILVHEMTHAAYDTVKCPFSSCLASSEFAAYAMQVRSLPPEAQAIFGAEVTLKSAPDSAAISAMMYLMAPDKFAKIAWLHFNTRPDPCGYMEQIMRGDIFFDQEFL